MSSPWTVVKVGGSLFDLPDLRQRLQSYLARFDADKVALVPGGGATADAVRAFDRVHRLGEETSHWLAIQALSVNARFLQTILPGATIIVDVGAAASVEVQVHGDVGFLRLASHRGSPALPSCLRLPFRAPLCCRHAVLPTSAVPACARSRW